MGFSSKEDFKDFGLTLKLLKILGGITPDLEVETRKMTLEEIG